MYLQFCTDPWNSCVSIYIVIKLLILNKTNGIDLLKNKIVKLEKVENVPENEKLLEYLRIKVIKEDEELNHLKEEYKDLPLKL
mgnify:CR=1 FL=1